MSDEARDTAREDFGRHSYGSSRADGVIADCGAQGYRLPCVAFPGGSMQRRRATGAVDATAAAQPGREIDGV